MIMGNYTSFSYHITYILLWIIFPQLNSKYYSHSTNNVLKELTHLSYKEYKEIQSLLMIIESESHVR